MVVGTGGWSAHLLGLPHSSRVEGTRLTSCRSHWPVERRRELLMAELKLDKSKTVLLMADFHTDGMGENPIMRGRRTFDWAKEVLDT